MEDQKVARRFQTQAGRMGQITVELPVAFGLHGHASHSVFASVLFESFKPVAATPLTKNDLHKFRDSIGSSKHNTF